MNAKRILSFLVLKPAITTRNLTSIALVGVFFLIYVASGGTISSLPTVQTGPGFGSIESNDDLSSTIVGGVNLSGDVQAPNERAAPVAPSSNNFEPGIVEDAGESARKKLLERLQNQQQSDSDYGRDLKQESASQVEVESPADDDFADIEARLNRK